jgi:hypothetical protein
MRFLLLIGTEPYHAFRSPDGRWLVTSKCGYERGAAEATLWNLAASQRVGSFSTELPILDVAFAQKGERFAVASGFNMSGSVRVFAARDAQPLAPAFGGPGKPFQLSFAPEGTRLAVGFANDPMENGSKVGIFDVEKGLALIEARFVGPASNVAMHFLPDGQRLTMGMASENWLYDVPVSAGPAPKWLPELARVVARRELDNTSTVRRIRVVASRLEDLKAKVAAAPDSPAKAVALMVLMKPGERPVSPVARQTRRERLKEEIRDWKQRGEAMRSSEGDLESQMLSLLEEARGLSHRTFGDAALLASIEVSSAELRKKMLDLLSTNVATIEKTLDSSKALSVSQTLRKLNGLAAADPAFASQVVALQERLAKANRKSSVARPQ